ncbi:MAG: hypothetical protein GY841_00505 [FCB group bacterium]|nr:hypothetical protein [FCB group bacterium]
MNIKNYLIGMLCLLLPVCCLAKNTEPGRNSLLNPLPIISGQTAVPATSPEDDRQAGLSRGMTGTRVSMKKAVLLSILLPGAGEYYAGSKFKGQVFMGVEAAIWSGFAALRMYGGWKKDDYKAYAAAQAGVDNSDKDEEFYDWIGFYENRDDFNQIGRLYYPERDYMPDSPANFWQWDSESSRLRYKEMKDDSKTAYRNSTFMLGLAILNRVVSSIDTYRTVKSAGRRVQSITQFGEYRLKVSPRLFGDNPSLKLSLSRKF